MKRRYAENGYINFVATPSTEVDDSTRRISLIFELDQGKQFRIAKVEVQDLDPGRKAALLSKFHPGDIFRNSEIEEAVQSLAPGLSLSNEDLQKSFSLYKNEKSATVTIVVDLSHQASAESQPETDLDDPW
jgi:outer membrane protein assembly factor BamA